MVYGKLPVGSNISSLNTPKLLQNYVNFCTSPSRMHAQRKSVLKSITIFSPKWAQTTSHPRGAMRGGEGSLNIAPLADILERVFCGCLIQVPSSCDFIDFKTMSGISKKQAKKSLEGTGLGALDGMAASAAVCTRHRFFIKSVIKEKSHAKYTESAFLCALFFSVFQLLFFSYYF